MPKCSKCRMCTGLIPDMYVECTGTCAGCGATEKVAGTFRRSDTELWCADDYACRERLGQAPLTLKP